MGRQVQDQGEKSIHRSGLGPAITRQVRGPAGKSVCRSGSAPWPGVDIAVAELKTGTATAQFRQGLKAQS